MNYHYLRLSLTKNFAPPLIEMARDTQVISRRDFLYESFMRMHNFEHRKRRFAYLPLGVAGDGDSIIISKIGRQRVDLVSSPPEDGFTDLELPNWRAANVLINTKDFRDGQKVAFQYRSDVGQPFTVFDSLVQHINERSIDSEYTIEVAPLNDKMSFWEKYNEHKGEITSVSFTFFTPNVLKIRSTLYEELRKAKEKYNASRVTERLENKRGQLVLDGQEVRDAVEIVSEGGGTAVIKAGAKKVYDSSKDHVVSTVQEDEPFQLRKPSVWQRIATSLF